MNASRVIGRVGALAVFFGVGAAAVTVCPLASAAPDSSASDSVHAAPTETSRKVAARPLRDRVKDGAETPKPRHRDLMATRRAARQTPDDDPAIADPTGAAPRTRKLAAVLESRRAVRENLSDTAPPEAKAERSTVTVAPSPRLKRAEMRAAHDVPPGVVSLALTSVLEVGFAAVVSVLNIGMPSPTAAPPRLKLNGYSLVPDSPEEIGSFYGRWTYLPGAPSLVQGQQKFNIIDPRTKASVGEFDALIGRGLGYNYTSLLVTDNGGGNVGTGPGQVPPVGSLIATFKVGPVGWAYSSMPTASGDVISFTIVTPFGSIPLPLTFDGAAGIADHTFDNRPVKLTNGYSIAPADPDGETITATSGIQPLFTSIQGRQVFGIYDSTGAQVGSFEGVFTTTSDILGTYTQAILVTANDGVNVGTGAGQIPPVGSVYNVVYAGGDDNYVLYQSLPAPTGDVVIVEQVGPGTVQTSTKTFIDASLPQSTQPLRVTRSLTLVPVSALAPVGVNGLPPREVQYQGYQRFDVYDAGGNRVGSFDADVATQSDLYGIHSEAVLVTNIVDGDAGTGRGETPPVGSVFNIVSLGDSGFGSVQFVMPDGKVDIKRSWITTPLGNIPVFRARTWVPDRVDVSFAHTTV
ncbi:hypothetical protein EUA04_07655 [Mycolicibacterium obuense]|uniref:Uncharacterized protein n=1 Tax=Mycolicibacterium obuense TaxID=1807 RepID=A0A4R5X8S7_9MYCO|nr:hypothetical protein [Mycolicibacterium obuense]TDL09827.1 hypothetical protein EUA04_07655 [Mycolicibacterium obuense]